MADLLNAIGDGFDDPELAKRYTTATMGPSQGRTSALNALLVLREASPLGAEAFGAATTQRPPALPESFAHLAGRGFEPARLTAMHHQHLAAGAQMMGAGLWHRPAYYGPWDRRDEAIAAEVRAVREGVGLIDVGTLGKLEIRGPDAAAFLERIYTGSFAKQPVGRTRYALRLRHDRRHHRRRRRLPPRRGPVLRHRHDLAASIRSTARCCAGMRSGGSPWTSPTSPPPTRRSTSPARWPAQVLQRLAGDVDLARRALPLPRRARGHAGRRAGAPAPGRLRRRARLRDPLPGELRRRLVGRCWSMPARPAASRPFGVEAQRVLRLEKGHVIVGQDTDGLTFPHEAGMEWAIAKRSRSSLASRAIRVQSARPLARRLVGFTLPLDAPLPPDAASSSAAAPSSAGSPRPRARSLVDRSSGSPTSTPTTPIRAAD